MGRYLDLAKKATGQSAPVSPALDMESRELFRQWVEEVQIMQRGDNPDWLMWSPACRAAWARSMLALAAEWGFPQLLTVSAREWLQSLD